MAHMNWVEIREEALQHNIQEWITHVGPNVAVMPVIKSNAYGHGMLLVARALNHMVQWFGVASTSEALELRKANILNTILVLSYVNTEEIQTCIEQGIDLPIYDPSSYRQISELAGTLKVRPRVHLKLDIGTTRIGFRPEQWQIVENIMADPRLDIVGVYSHYSSSEEDPERTRSQLAEFRQLVARLPRQPQWVHVACSAACATQYLGQQTLARVGISTYGLQPSDSIASQSPIKLQRALSWKTRVVQIKPIPAGTSIGYGATFIADRPMTVGVIAAGYNEGLPRQASSQGHVLIHGKPARFLGRICMNLSMVDVTKIPLAKPGDPVILIGNDGNEQITAEDLASWSNTSHYEIVTRINPCLARIAI